MSLTEISPLSGSGVMPGLVLVQGNEQKNIVLTRTPFSIGRKVDKDLVIADPRVSRDHAEIQLEEGQFYLIDLSSKHGTFVNGERIQRQKLERNDRLEFGARDSTYVIFHPAARDTSNTAREFLSQISVIKIPQESEAADLQKLTLFLEAARKLNTAGVLDEILINMLDTTLQLTGAERGYVFLKDTSGQLRLAAGRSQKGEPLLDDKTISHSILDDALRSNSEFMVTDTSQMLDLSGRQSIVAYDLRTVVCIPLRKRQVHAARGGAPAGSGTVVEALGALYMDSRFASRDVTTVDKDILHAIATEAASLIENARLVQAEEEARRYQQELSIAAGIQQRLMQVKIPEVPFARLNGRNFPCRSIGGDFFDAINTKEGLAVVLADVSGKGVSAALLASTLQGMIYSHLIAGMSLLDVIKGVNRYFIDKLVGEKYATVLLARLRRDGELEYVNCGHVPPLLVCGNEVIRPPHGNVPVGLLPDATFESARCQLRSGDRVILVTDGVTEAENPLGEFFDDSRLEDVAAKNPTLEGIFSAVTEFCAGNPLSDDCTVVEVTFFESGA
ncbi:MAG TPA: SpoIIE family protein phosphatase [Candidatus Sulfotelmatobacter sp.]|nr:SpoIIE family protein phosphatase [Candidatus Sulfotelmatobacter sp.]